jgi:surface protein
MAFTPANKPELRQKITEILVNENAEIPESWDLRNVHDFSRLFQRLSTQRNFNTRLSCMSNWNVDHVTNMKGMFADCLSFNIPLNNWNVSNVRNMDFMFYRCLNFNQPLTNWRINPNATTVNTFLGTCMSPENMPPGIPAPPVLTRDYILFRLPDLPHEADEYNEVTDDDDDEDTDTDADDDEDTDTDADDDDEDTDTDADDDDEDTDEDDEDNDADEPNDVPKDEPKDGPAQEANSYEESGEVERSATGGRRNKSKKSRTIKSSNKRSNRKKRTIKRTNRKKRTNKRTNRKKRTIKRSNKKKRTIKRSNKKKRTIKRHHNKRNKSLKK